ncbi:amidohydrolase family protein [Motilibacter aurantiacus]|uniref:amidohydrolase family protein n=1 Tax=Motilibacter aurantiacus TaxID=2714955 RepID=UPI00140AC904|nr:amidohydrolase family protein [Motilibacter aurantiacus]NHC47634.1 amidohydrolase family protein [Motilibacter aurantiacus]
MGAADGAVLIEGGLVLVGDPLEADIRRADVLVQDSRIAAVGTGLAIPAGARVLSARGRLVAPGFVDTHHHLWETTMRGAASEWSIIDFLWGMRFHHTAAHTPEDVYAGSYAAAVAALDAGITTTLDHMHAANSREHAEEGLRAVGDSGIRARWMLGLTTSDPQAPSSAGQQDRRDLLASLNEAQPFSVRQRVMVGVAANDLASVPWAQTVQEYALAAELGLGLTVHARSVPGPGLPAEIEWLHRARLLGPNQVYSHVTAASDDELRMLSDAGAAVSSTPETESQMGMGFPVWNRARRLGVEVGLGTDIQANNPADPFRCMLLALRLATVQEQEPGLQESGLLSLSGRPVSLVEVLHVATLGGARALGMGDRVGSIEVGKQADLLIVRQDALHHSPVVDPIATYVLHTRPSDVETVLVDGQVRKESGRMSDGADHRARDLVVAAWARLEPVIAARGGLLPPRPEDLLLQLARTMVANAPALDASPA